MSLTVRGYPIRTSKRKWNIPLQTQHVCNSDCGILVSAANGRLEFSENSQYINGRCLEYGMFVYTPVPINTFSISSCKLFYKNVKVIPDSVFKVYIYYPLSNVMEATITSPSSSGFTLQNLLQAIKMLYEFIYQEEEQTSDSREFHLKKRCTDCGNMDLSKICTELTTEQILNVQDEMCSICYDTYKETAKTETAVSLSCKHYFHTNCIKKWSEKSGTCPICRASIYSCEKCDGKGIIYYTYTGVVIPLEDRIENNIFRNATNGIFGIHTYGIEDLIIEKLFYDRVNKRLFIDVSNY